MKYQTALQDQNPRSCLYHRTQFKLVSSNNANWSHNSPARFAIDDTGELQKTSWKVGAPLILLNTTTSLPDIVANPRPSVRSHLSGRILHLPQTRHLFRRLFSVKVMDIRKSLWTGSITWYSVEVKVELMVGNSRCSVSRKVNSACWWAKR